GSPPGVARRSLAPEAACVSGTSEGRVLGCLWRGAPAGGRVLNPGSPRSEPNGSCPRARAPWQTIAKTSVAARRRAALDGILRFRRRRERHRQQATEPLMLAASGQVKPEPAVRQSPIRRRLLSRQTRTA